MGGVCLGIILYVVADKLMSLIRHNNQISKTTLRDDEFGFEPEDFKQIDSSKVDDSSVIFNKFKIPDKHLTGEKRQMPDSQSRLKDETPFEVGAPPQRKLIFSQHQIITNSELRDIVREAKQKNIRWSSY